MIGAKKILLGAALAAALPFIGGCASHRRGYDSGSGYRLRGRADNYGHTPWVDNNNRTGGTYGYNGGGAPAYRRSYTPKREYRQYNGSEVGGQRNARTGNNRGANRQPAGERQQRGNNAKQRNGRARHDTHNNMNNNGGNAGGS